MTYIYNRYPDGAVRLRNPNIELMDQDILYHLALGSGSVSWHSFYIRVFVRKLKSALFTVFSMIFTKCLETSR